MNEEEIKENNCKTCKYYAEHYVIISTRFYPIGGHCKNKNNYHPHKKQPRAIPKNCTEWESNQEERAQKKKNIVEALKSIDEHVSQIAEILRIYEET